MNFGQQSAVSDQHVPENKQPGHAYQRRGWRHLASYAVGLILYLATDAQAVVVNVDHDVMYVVTAVDAPTPPSKKPRLNYTAVRLTPAQKEFLQAGHPGSLAIYSYNVPSTCPDCPAEYAEIIHPADYAIKSVTSWNKTILNNSHPVVGTYGRQTSAHPYTSQSEPMISQRICLGFMAKDSTHPALALNLPDTGCVSFPPPPATCTMTATDVYFGSVAVGQHGEGNGRVSVSCTGRATVQFDRIIFGSGGEGLRGYHGDINCQNQVEAATITHPGGDQSLTRCLAVSGSFNSTGVKAVPGTVNVTYW